MREIFVCVILIGVALYAWKRDTDLDAYRDTSVRLDEKLKASERALDRLEERIAAAGYSVERSDGGVVRLVESESIATAKAEEEARLAEEEAAEKAADQEAKDIAEAVTESKIEVLLAMHDELERRARSNKDLFDAHTKEIDAAESRLRAAKYNFGSFQYQSRSLHSEAQQKAAWNANKEAYLRDISAKLQALDERDDAVRAAYSKARSEISAEAAKIQSTIRSHGGDYRHWKSSLSRVW